MAAITTELKAVAKAALNYRGQRELLVREWFFRAAARFTPYVATEAGDLTFLVSTADEVIGRVTFMYRGFDEAAMARALAELGRRVGDPQPLRGRTLLDVGGNIGTTSAYAVRRFGAARAIAFEPAPDNVHLLRQNVALNGLTDRIDVHAVAVSDVEGELVLELSPENSGDHRVRTGTGPETDGGQVVVPARPLDALVAEGAIDPAEVGLLWIDVQGHEPAVLAGAGRLLERGVPVVTEYWPAALRDGAGLDRFHDLVARRFREVVDLGHAHTGTEVRALPAAEVASLAARYPGPADQCDLLLLP